MYSDHFGLTGRPFQLTPDPKFWFESSTHKKAMAYLGYGLAQGEGFIVITGEIGSGKTTLVGHLIDTVDPARVKAVKIVSTQVEGDDMLRVTANAFGLPSEGVEKAQLLARIESHIEDLAKAGQRTLLIVDEAQNLPQSSLEELRMLSNFQAGDKAMLQILMLGQPELRDRLNHADELEQLRQRVIATHHLAAMEADEVGPYVQYRMSVVGWAGKPTFADGAFAALYQHSGGVPRKINTLMTRILMLASIEGLETIDTELIESVIVDLEKDETAGETPIRPSPAHDPHTLDLAARVAMLEAQAEEQGAALRRVLGLLIAWVEADEAKHVATDIRRAPTA
jgi:general secretion pathway protein A